MAAPSCAGVWRAEKQAMNDPEPARPNSRQGAVFSGRRIVIGITGGIAAYKTATIVSRLAQAGAEVTVAMTEAAAHFVSPLTFQALSARPVYTSSWQHVESQDPQHISLASAADAVLVAPCSMDCLARLATGRADDVVCLILAAVDRAKTPVLLAPSMNSVMWMQASTQRNVATLHGDGFTIVGPGEGWQACRHVGAGRMSEPEDLIIALGAALKPVRRAGVAAGE
jgi:phosphopantothenoylcysteine decarboxylase/phosphopantothenate--cysteine ligase